ADNVNRLAELQKRGCLFSPGFMVELNRIWTAGLQPTASMLTNYSHWRNREMTMCELISESVEFEQLRNPHRSGREFAMLAIAGADGQAVDQRNISLTRRSLYGGANDPLSLGQLSIDEELRRNFALCRLLDILAMQCLLATLDSPR